ncbi:MAG: HupE/UreJ family protein, partial [bacterium]|nr:HupE/UreJ family protein [bacterium]
MIRWAFLLLAAAILLGGFDGARAHETRPGCLEIREGSPGRYAAVWKHPARGETTITLTPVFPAECEIIGPGKQEMTPGAVLTRATLACPGGLRGKTIRIAGLEATMTDALIRVYHADGAMETHLARPASPSASIGAAGGGGRRAAAYLRLGVEHILMGVDHLLFVLGLLLIVRDRWMLLKTVTSFTAAHGITLALATLGYVKAPLPPLNAAIALSILFLGPEIVRSWRGRTSLTIRHPWVAAFAFGLLHGLGFATGLTTLGLPRAEIPAALLLFNVGVELGQIAFVALILLLNRSFGRLQLRWPRWAEMIPGYVVGSLGAYWT